MPCCFDYRHIQMIQIWTLDRWGFFGGDLAWQRHSYPRVVEIDGGKYRRRIRIDRVVTRPFPRHLEHAFPKESSLLAAELVPYALARHCFPKPLQARHKIV